MADGGYAQANYAESGWEARANGGNACGLCGGSVGIVTHGGLVWLAPVVPTSAWPVCRQ